MKSLFPKM